MRTYKKLLGAALAACAFALAPAALANGLVATPADLPAAERAKLASEIAAFKKQKPEAFEALRNIKGHKPEVYKQFRNPVPMVSRELHKLGPDGVLPMLEALAFQAPELTGATEHERQVFVSGVIAEVGRQRDARSAVVLQTVFAKQQPAWVAWSAAEAMGRLCDVSSLDRLRLGLNDASRRSAAIHGLGQCRSLEAAEVLAAELDAVVSPEEATAVAKALGTLGSSWAWDAIARGPAGEARKAEGLKARAVAAAALVRGFVRLGSLASDSDESQRSGRDAHRKALTRVDHPATASIVAAHASGADAATRSQLEAIAQQLEAKRRK